MRKNSPELSIVVLCYRSGLEVSHFVEKTQEVLMKNNINDFELILVGNYFPESGDITPQVVKEIARNNEHIKCVSKPKEGMMGWDMKSGFEIADGQYIAVIDGDGQMPVVDLARVFKEIKNKNVDIVKTYRLIRGDGYWRKFISIVYNWVYRSLFPGLRSKDINSKPKIMTRELYKQLHLASDDWFIDAEIMIQARRLKTRISEIPTDFLGLSGKRKSFIKIPSIFQFIKNLIIYRVKEFKY